MMIFTFTIYSNQENMLALTALAITIESFASGWTATIVVVLMSRICQKAYAASQYAFLTSLVFALKVGIGPVAASVVYAYGWDGFFALSVLSLAPPCLLLATKRIRDAVAVYSVIRES